jgi:hypothetical protein
LEERRKGTRKRIPTLRKGLLPPKKPRRGALKKIRRVNYPA